MGRRLGGLGPVPIFLGAILALADGWMALLVWTWLFRVDGLTALILALLALLLAGALLRLSTTLPRGVWLGIWVLVGSWLLAGTSPLLAFLPVPQLWVAVVWTLLGAAGYLGWWSHDSQPQGLHKAHWANQADLSDLASRDLPSNGLLLGRDHRGWLAVRATAKRQELGSLLIVGPTRSGKGLLATTQLLTWKHSAVVNDIKGEIFNATAGYRASLGPVFVIDPTGVGHCYDPLSCRHGEDGLYSAATSLLVDPQEGEGKIFTQRAVSMLASLFGAARAKRLQPLPFVRLMVGKGLQEAAAELQAIDPRLATRFLDGPYQSTDIDNRFLLSAWGTLTARLWPLLTENLVKTFNGHDFSPSQLLLSGKLVTVYLRWPERDLLALSPLVRLIWDSLIGELITTYDARAGTGCRPVLLLVDEAGRAPIPSLADHATTVVGRGISIWLAVQSLSQLEAIYGKSRAQVIKDNMDSQVYYRPTDLATAEYLEKRLGKVSAFAHSTTSDSGGNQRSESHSEQAVSLLTAQDVMQLEDEQIIAFHRKLPPIQAQRIDWRGNELLEARRRMSPPILSRLPAVSDDDDQTLAEPQLAYVE